MKPLRHLAAGLYALVRRRRLDADLDEELAAYLEAATADKVRLGMTPQAAWRAARAEMGSIAAIKDHTRAAGWEVVVEACGQDIRHAWRALRQRAGLAVAAAGMIGLGIGITTSMFM